MAGISWYNLLYEWLSIIIKYVALLSMWASHENFVPGPNFLGKLFWLGTNFLKKWTYAENFVPGEVHCFSQYRLIVANCHDDPDVLALCMQV